jgi:hypothetical protein
MINENLMNEISVTADLIIDSFLLFQRNYRCTVCNNEKNSCARNISFIHPSPRH